MHPEDEQLEGEQPEDEQPEDVEVEVFFCLKCADDAPFGEVGGADSDV